MRNSLKILFVAVLFLAEKSIAAASDVTGKVTSIEVHSSDPVDQPACEVGKTFVLINNAWYWFPGTGDEGKTLLSIFEVAKSTGASVFIRVTDQIIACNAGYKKITIARLED